MNKQKLLAQLKSVGVIVDSLEFSFEGYMLDMQLDISKGKGWEEFESTPLEGFEVVKTRRINEYYRQILLIPNSISEFNDYIKRCNVDLGMSKIDAYDNLKCIIESCASQHALCNFLSYRPRYIMRKKGSK